MYLVKWKAGHLGNPQKDLKQDIPEMLQQYQNSKKVKPEQPKPEKPAQKKELEPVIEAPETEPEPKTGKRDAPFKINDVVTADFEVRGNPKPFIGKVTGFDGDSIIVRWRAKYGFKGETLTMDPSDIALVKS